MKKIVKIIIYSCFVFISLFSANDLKGTHIVGGDITYKYLGKDTFLLTLTLRRDCQLGSPEAQFDDPALISIYDGATGRLRIDLGYFGGLMVPFSKDDTLNTFVRSDCGFEGTQVCVHETKYVKKVHLPFSSTGYILAYQRCCRNSSLNNIVDPLDAGSTYYVKINGPSMTARNNSPVFKEWPDIYICADKDLVFDHSAVDPDGDSLVYKLWNPIYGLTMRSPKLSQPFIVKPEFIPVQYLPGFGVENFLGGTPLNIDSRTGVITAKPNAVGQFLVGIEVEEYRNGVLIGSTMRDFQYNVRVCSQPPKADFTGPLTSCKSLTIPFENKSLSTERFEWNFNYPDTNKSFITTEENPTFTFPAEGVYQVRLLAVRGSDNCRDEVIKKVSVFNLNYEAKFSVTPVECKIGDSVRIQLADLSTIDRNEFYTINRKWIVQQENSTRIFTGDKPEFYVNTNESLTITLEVEANNGCTAQLTRQIEPLEVMLVANFEVTGISCPDVDSITLSFNDVSTYYQSQDSISSRKWIITFNGSTLIRNEKTFSITLPRKDITVKLIATGGPCIDSTFKSFPVSELFPKVTLNSEVGCEGDDARLRFWPSVGNGALFKVQSYFWLVGNERIDADTLTMIRNFNQSVTVRLLAVLTNGCEVEVSKTIDLKEFQKTADFTATPARCPDDENVEYQIAYTGTSGFNSLMWSITENGIITTSTLERFIYKAKKNGTININVLAVYDGNCSRSKAQSIIVSNFAEIDLVGSTIDVCPFEPKKLFNSSNPNLTYTWSPSSGLNLTDRLNPIVETDKSTIYTVTASDGLCSVTKQINVNVLDSLQLDVEIMSASCNDNFVLKAKGGRGEGSYEWSTSNTFNNIIGRDSIINFTISQGMQKIFVRYMGPFCNSVIKSIELTNELPEISKPSNLLYCGGDSLTVKIENLRSFQNLSFIWANSSFINSSLTNSAVNVVTKRTDKEIINLPFTVTNQFGCSLKDTVSILPSIRDSAFINFNVTNCDSFIVCFNVGGRFDGEYEVDFGDGSKIIRNSNSSSQFCYTYAKEGTYNLKINSLKSICGFDVINKTIQLNRLNQDLGAKDTVVVCKDVDVTLSLREGLPQLTVVWKNAQGAQAGTGNGITVKAINNTKYTIEATDVNGCKFTDEIVVNVLDNLPMVALPADFRACQGDTAVLPVRLLDPSIQTNIVWAADPRIISGGNTLQPLIGVASNETGPVVLKYTATNALGCITNGEISFAVGQRPVARIDAKVEDCGALRVCFKAEGQDLRSLRWDFGDLSTNGDTSRNADVCYTYPKAGIYQVSLRSLEAFCDFVPVTRSLELNTLNGDLGAKDTVVVCKDVDVTLSLREGLPQLTVVWKNAQGAQVGTGNSITVKAINNTKYTIEATDVNGCKFTDEIVVNVLDNLPMVALPADFRACQGDTAVLPVRLLDPSIQTNIVWAADPRIISGGNTLQPLIGIANNEAGPIVLKYTATNALGCITSGEISFAVGQRPVARIDAKVEDCGALRVCFKAEGQDLRSLRWDFGDLSTNGDTSRNADVCYTYPKAGIYQVSLRSLEAFCDFVPVTRSLELNTINGDLGAKDTVVVCKDVDVTLSLREGLPQLTVVWKNAQGAQAGTGNSITVKAINNTKYTIEATDVNGCKFTDEIVVNVLDNLPMVALPADFRACQGDTAVLPVSLLDPSIQTNIVWAADPRIMSGGNTLQPLIGIANNETGPVVLKYTATNALGCITNGEISFAVGQRPVARIDAKVEDCGALRVCFKAEGQDLRSLRWDFGDLSTNGDTSRNADVCYTYPKAGIYQVSLRSLEAFCNFVPVTRSLELNTLNGDLGAKDTVVVCKDVDVTLSLREGLPQLTVVWKNAQGAQVGTGNSITVKAINNTKYTIEATDVNGCKFTDEIVVNVLDNLPMVALPADFRACQGDTAVLPVRLLDPSIQTNIVWAADPRIISGGNTLQPLIGIANNEAGPVVLKYTATNALGCITNGEVSFAVGQRPVARIDAKVEDCGALRVCFKAEGQDLRSLRWDFGDLSSDGDTSRNADVCYTYPKAGIYQVSLRSLEAFCDFVPVTRSLELNTLNGDMGAKDTVVVCKDVDVTLSLREGLPQLTVVWKNAQGVQIGTGNSITVKAINNTKYTIEATDLNGCKFTDEIVVNVLDNLPMVALPADFRACQGDTAVLPVSLLDPSIQTNIVWAADPRIISGGNTLQPLIGIANNETGPVVLKYTATNALGCITNGEISFAVGQRPVARIDVKVEDCGALRVCFKAEGQDLRSLRWDFGDLLTNGDTSRNADVCYTYPKAGIYQVSLRSLEAFCNFVPVTRSLELNTLNGDLGAKDTVVVCKDVDVTLSLREGLPQLTVVWKNAQGAQVGTGNSITVKAINNTKYIIEATDVNGCKFTDEIVVNVLDNLPMVALPADFRACQGDTAVLPVRLLDPSIQTNIVWAADPRIISGGNTLQPLIGIANNETGPVVLKYTATNALGCITNGEISFAVGQRPVARIDAKVEDCGALRVCFKAEGQDLRSLRWDFGDLSTNGDTSRNADVCYTYPKAGIYQVSLRSLEAFCDFVPVTKEVVLYKGIDLVPNDSVKVCKGNFVTISVADSFSKFIIKWFDSTKKEIGTGSMLNYKVDKTEILFVEGTDQNGCKYLDSFIVVAIEDFPVISIPSPFTVCKGDTNTLPLIVTGGSTDFTIQWDADPRIISGSNTLNPVLAIPSNASGKFILRYHITSKFGCLSSNTIEIEIKDRPKVEIGYKVENCIDFRVCFDIKGQFEIGVIWDFGVLNSTTDSSTSFKPCFTFPKEGKYIVTLTNATGFCDFDPVSVNVQLNNVTDIISVDSTSACLRDSVTLSAKDSNINLRYRWTNQQGVVVSTLKSFRYPVLRSEKIFAIATDENGCEFRDSVSIRGINEFPQLVFVSPLSVCVGDTVNFPMANGNRNHIINILWDASPRIIGRRDTLNPLIGIPSNVVNPFTIGFTASTQFGCTIRDSVRFIPGAPPVVDFSFVVEDCDNFKVCFKAIGDIKGFPYWNFGDPNTENDFSLDKEVCYTYPGPGTYKVELINKTNFCKFAPVTKFITLNQGLQFFDRDTQEVCKGVVTNIPVPARAQGLRFEWFDLRGNRIGNSNPLAIRVDSLTAVVLRVLDVNNCPFRDTLVLNPFAFDYELKVPQVFCLDKEIEAEILIKNSGVNFTYQWLPLDCIKRGQGTPKVMIDVKAAKDVIVIVTHPTIGCTLRDTFNIEPKRVVVNVAAAPDTVIRLLKSTDIFVSNPQPGWTYQWSNGNSNIRQTVSPSVTTTYTVTVTDREGCTGTASITIRVIQPDCEEDVFIPNAFTPNNDRVNDILYVRSNYIDEMELIIFNRWGQEVFKSVNQNDGWDGAFKGVTLAPDAFAYYLKVKCIDGTEIQRKGNVSILK